MFLDNEALFSDNQAITLAALEPSTNVLDLGAPGITAYNPVQLRRNMDKGHTPLLIQVTEDFSGAITSMNIKVQQSVDEAFTVPLDVISVDVPVAELVAGYISPIDELPRGISERYVRLAYTPNAAAATGRVTSGIVGAVDGAYTGNK